MLKVTKSAAHSPTVSLTLLPNVSVNVKHNASQINSTLLLNLMAKTYPYLKYNLPLVALRIAVYAPVVIASSTANFIAESLDKFRDKVDKMLPQGYTEEWVEWDQLPKRNQEAIEYIAQKRDTTKERILIQTVKP